MQSRETLVFMEARPRRNLNFGDVLLSVDRAKRNRLTARAQHYLQAQSHACAARSDVVVFDEAERPGRIRNAFEADGLI
jgi:Holliday junction resolvase-like predicted endonuclease